MTYTSQAIEKAIEGGWEPKGQKFSIGALSYKVQALSKVKYKERFFLDPLFWQALGKALGWQKGYHGVEWESQEWLYQWHRFINWISEGKSIDDFFKELLK